MTKFIIKGIIHHMNTRQKKKREKQINKQLLERYPFLGGTPSYTDYDEFPRGWRKAFGIDLLNEIQGVLTEFNIPSDALIIEQIKEKYGELTFYYNWKWRYEVPQEADQLIDGIINDYSVVSRNICIFCGRPDSGVTFSGWVYPVCKSCWRGAEPYEEMVILDEIPDTYKIRHFSGERIKWVEERNIKDKADRIRARWKRAKL